MHSIFIYLCIDFTYKQHHVEKSLYSFGELLKTQEVQVGLPILCISLYLFRGQHFLTSLLRRKGENELFRRI